MNLQEFENWAVAQKQVCNPNGTEKGQCVSLVQEYLFKVFGISEQSHGNAKDWANSIPTGFAKLAAKTALQAGDIIVYGANHGGGFGHIAIIDQNEECLQQNYTIALHVSVDKTFTKDYIAVLRHIIPTPAKPVIAPVVPKTYTVKSGDTLSKIALEFNTTAANLVAKNGIKNPSLIKPGQVLKI